MEYNRSASFLGFTRRRGRLKMKAFFVQRSSTAKEFKKRSSVKSRQSICKERVIRVQRVIGNTDERRSHELKCWEMRSLQMYE